MLILEAYMILNAAIACCGTIILKQGDDAHFGWNLTSKPGIYDIISIKRNNIKTVFILSNSIFEVSQNYRNRVIFFGSFERGLIQFSLRSIKTTDAGLYSANYDNSGQELVILAKPEIPVVQVTNSVLEASELVLNCSTQSKSVQRGNVLKMKYKWYVDGKTAFVNQRRFQKHNSILRIQQITRKDSGKVITCQAFERRDVVSEMSEQLVLDVKYAPSELLISPGNLKYRLLKERSLQDITCNSDCNPKCSFKWVKNESDLQKRNAIIPGNVLLLKNVSSSDSGIYVCIASNEFGVQRSEDIQVEVLNSLSLPDIIELEKPIAGRDLKLMCFTNESSIYTVEQISWNTSRHHGQQKTRYEIHGNIFKLNDIRLVDSGTTITCTVLYLDVMSVTSRSYQVLTLFASEDIKFSTNITNFDVRPRDVIPAIYCETQCRPKCEFSWYRNLYTKVTNGNVLSLGQMELEKAGKYICVAENAYGKKTSKTIEINIYDINLEQNFTCVEGKSIDITCNVVTNRRNILFLPWIQCVDNTILKSTPGNTENRRNILKIPNCSIQHIGNYSCRIQIDNKAYRSSSTELTVLGKPKIILYKTTTSLDKTSASILVHFISVPSPANVTWFRNSSIIRGSEKFYLFWNHGSIQKTILDKTVFYDGFHAAIHISKLNRKDYGLYILEIANQYGMVRKEIYLHPRESSSFPLMWFIIAGTIGGTVLIILFVLIIIVRKHRRKKRNLQIKETLERIRQRLAAKENDGLWFREFEETDPAMQYQKAVDDNLEMESITEKYVKHDVSSSSDSFVYDYPEVTAAAQPAIDTQGSYEDKNSDKNSSLYENIEEYDVHELSNHLLSDRSSVTNCTSTVSEEATNQPFIDASTPLNNLPADTILSTNRNLTDMEGSTNQPHIEAYMPLNNPPEDTTSRTSTESTVSMNKISSDTHTTEWTDYPPTERCMLAKSHCPAKDVSIVQPSVTARNHEEEDGFSEKSYKSVR